MSRLMKPLWFLLAVLFLIEAWFWEKLEPALDWLVRLPWWRRLRLGLVSLVRHLPPYAALVLFVVPLALVEPMKLLALWHLAQGRVALAVVTFAVAQILALGLSVFLFGLVRGKLLSIPWFARLYALVLSIEQWARRQVEPARRVLAEMMQALRLGRGRMLRRWRLLRARVQARRRKGAE